MERSRKEQHSWLTALPVPQPPPNISLLLRVAPCPSKCHQMATVAFFFFNGHLSCWIFLLLEITMTCFSHLSRCCLGYIFSSGFLPERSYSVLFSHSRRAHAAGGGVCFFTQTSVLQIYCNKILQSVNGKFKHLLNLAPVLQLLRVGRNPSNPVLHFLRVPALEHFLDPV